MKNFKNLIILGGFVIFILSGVFATSLIQNQTNSQNVEGLIYPNPNVVYPDPTLTPGAVFSNVTASEVCVSGYSSKVRNVSVSTKKIVYQEYGKTYPQPTGAYEVDHFIPLELGGSNDLTNLFLEPANPKPGFHEKDIVENYLHDQVCNHGMDLLAAQQAIQSDWYKVYIGIPNKDQYNFAGN